MQWTRLLPYAESGPVTLADRRTILPVIKSLRRSNVILEDNFIISQKIAEGLGAKQVQPDNIPAAWLDELGDCPPVITSAAERSLS